MRAVVVIRDYGRDTHLLCPSCGLDRAFGRDDRGASAAARGHNEAGHEFELAQAS